MHVRTPALKVTGTRTPTVIDKDKMTETHRREREPHNRPKLQRRYHAARPNRKRERERK